MGSLPCHAIRWCKLHPQSLRALATVRGASLPALFSPSVIQITILLLDFNSRSVDGRVRGSDGVWLGSIVSR